MDKMPKIQEPIVESMEEKEEEPMDIPEEVEVEIKEKVKIPQDEIFKNTSKKETIPEVKKIKKPKRVISDEHRERLKKGREKALANRKAKALAKKQKTEEKKEYESIPDELKEEFKRKAVAPPPVSNMLSEEKVAQISAKATKKALEDYEILRKQRKEVKNKLKQEELDRQKVRNVIQKATQRDTTFDFCFQ